MKGMSALHRKLSILKISVLISGFILLMTMATLTFRIIIPWFGKMAPGYTRTPRGTTTVDVNFTFVQPSLEPQMPTHELDLLILVSSAPGSDYLFARNAIRETWGKNDECTSEALNCKTHRWKVVFLLGKSYNPLLDSQIVQEALSFDDILMGNFQDTYYNLVIKLLMGFSWTSKVNCRFVLKADDDTYVHVTKLLVWLRNAPSRLYAGHVHANVEVSRDPNERNPLPPGSSFKEKYFPPYCLGAFYVLSRNILPGILEAVNRWRPWPIEDTYMSVLARDVGISATDVYGFMLTSRASLSIHRFTDCQWSCAIALGHRLTPSHLQKIHGKFVSMSSFNSTHCAKDSCSDERRASRLYLILCVLLFITVPFIAYIWIRKRSITPSTDFLLKRKGRINVNIISKE